MSGAVAPVLWAEGKREEVLRYVAGDVRTTLDVATACEALGSLRWISRSGKVRRMDAARRVADGGGGSGTAYSEYYLDVRAVAAREVHGVDGVTAFLEQDRDRQVPGKVEGSPWMEETFSPRYTGVCLAQPITLRRSRWCRLSHC
jgi:hypothetical protein